MQPYILKAVDEAALNEALIAAGVLIEVDDDAHVAPGFDLDVIGVIHLDSGKFDKDGDPVFDAQEGYHANLMGELTAEQEALLPIIPMPNQRYRIFAGEQV